MFSAEQLENRLTPAVFFDGATVHVVGSDAADTVIVWQMGSVTQVSQVSANGYERLVLPTSVVQAVSAGLGGGNDLFLSYSPVSVFVDGGSGDDTLFAGSGFASLNGGDGNDVLRGGYGFGQTNVLVGGNGADVIYCGFGNDVVVALEDQDTLLGFGAYGADVLVS